MTTPLMMGAVAYAPKVVTIWEGFKEYFRRHDFEFDYVLYSNYERQVEAQFDGTIPRPYQHRIALGGDGIDHIHPNRHRYRLPVQFRDFR